VAPGGSSSALATSHGRGYSGGRDYGSSDHGNDRGHGRNRSSRGGRSGRGFTDKSSRPQCQVCLKFGHTANNCWHHFEEDYVPKQRTVAATSSSGIDHNWYTDSGAPDHITGDLDKLTMHDRYADADQVHASNGIGMTISHIGKCVIPTPCRDLVLKDVLHVPSTQKNLILVHRVTLDNDTFIEFHPYFFLIKDRKTRKVHLHGPCKGNLYPLPPSSSKYHKLVFSAIKLSAARWHSRIGHPAQHIVRRVVSTNNLPCATSDSVDGSFYDACACTKAHQLPYSVPLSHSSVPLELIFSYVWGTAIDLFGHKKYYVSFIDDYSKFTWLYLLRSKSKGLKYFLEFQRLVERQFDRKILAIQSDWGGEY
jgi:hypothetical protein